MATFNEFGYEDLIDEWNAANDDIKIKQVKVGTWDDAKANLYTKLAAGSGLSDIEAIEGDAMPAIMAESDAFADLTDPSSRAAGWTGRPPPATNADGQMIGYGTDIGPEGICYRSRPVQEGRPPTDRDEVARLMGTWDDYFATGSEFVKAMPGTAWFDSSGGLAQAMLNQVANPFEDRRRGPSTSRTPSSKAVYETVTATSRAACRPRSPSGATTGPRSFQNDGFATMACPGLDARRHRGQLRGRRRAGTSRTSSPAAAATGAARS